MRELKLTNARAHPANAEFLAEHGIKMVSFEVISGRVPPRFIRTHEVPPRRPIAEDWFAVRGEHLRLPRQHTNCAAAVIAGDVHLWASPQLLYVNGSANIDRTSDLFLVCDGPVRINQCVDSIILANGDVTFTEIAVSSQIITSGIIRYDQYCHVHNMEVREKQKQPLAGVVRFFSLADVGLEVAANRNGVEVMKVADRPFGAAGLLPGDVVRAVNDIKVDSPESLRRAIRRRLAECGMLAVHVQRGDKPVTVSVPVRRCRDLL
jgi:hypothetical protein